MLNLPGCLLLIEVLHTVPLGPVKYCLKEGMSTVSQGIEDRNTSSVVRSVH